MLSVCTMSLSPPAGLLPDPSGKIMGEMDDLKFATRGFGGLHFLFGTILSPLCHQNDGKTMQQVSRN